MKPDRIEWVLRYLLDRSFGKSGENYQTPYIEATPTFDDGADFIEAFRQKFPTGKADPNLTNTSARLSNVLRTMHRDGWMERWRLGNEVDLPGTPRWQYVYQLPQWLINDFKTGKETPRGIAGRYKGD